jgi:hypothetical protein
MGVSCLQGRMRAAKYLCLLAVLVCLIGAGWLIAPASLAEAIFRYRLSEAALSQKAHIRIAELTTFKWEEVCEHHPYDGDFKHPRSGRIYHPPNNTAHDGTWVLLFIENNGEPTYISGSCKRGGAQIGSFGCLPREQAVLHLSRNSECLTYTASPPVSNNVLFHKNARVIGNSSA